MRPKNYFNRNYQKRWYVQTINIGLVCLLIGLFYSPFFFVGMLLLFIGANSHYHDSKKRLKNK